MPDDEKTKLHENMKQEIRSLLISSPKTKYGGLSGSLLYFDYKQLNSGKEVPYVELGFRSFLGLLRSMPDVVRIEYKENSPSYRVHPVYDQSTAHIQKMVLEQNDKYEQQNKLYIQNWYSNNPIPMNFYNNDQFSFFQNSLPHCACDSVQTNNPVYQNFFRHKSKNSLRRSFPPNFSVPEKRKGGSHFEPYLLLTPPDNPEHNEKTNCDDLNPLPCVSSTSLRNHSTSSTPNTFIETPPNFDLNDYHLNELVQSSEKDNHEEINTQFSVNNQIEEIHDEPFLPASTNIISDVLPNLEKNQPFTSPSISPANDPIPSPTHHTTLLPSINDEEPLPDNEIIVEVSQCNVQEESKIDENGNLKKRINDAIRQCLHFRYIHRLCEIEFEYRHYPLSNEILSIKSHFERIAFHQYQQELEDFRRTISQFNSSINDQKCQTMFDQYIALQRNYHYMIKLINKNRK